MIITKQFIMKHRTDKGAWTQPQLESLGVSWPPRKGWMNRVIGKDISEDGQETFKSKIKIKAKRKQTREKI